MSNNDPLNQLQKESDKVTRYSWIMYMIWAALAAMALIVIYLSLDTKFGRLETDFTSLTEQLNSTQRIQSILDSNLQNISIKSDSVDSILDSSRAFLQTEVERLWRKTYRSDTSLVGQRNSVAKTKREVDSLREEFKTSDSLMQIKLAEKDSLIAALSRKFESDLRSVDSLIGKVQKETNKQSGRLDSLFEILTGLTGGLKKTVDSLAIEVDSLASKIERIRPRIDTTSTL